MNIIDKLLTPGKTHGRTGQMLTPKGVTIHWVGNPGSSALANRNYFENGSAGNHVSAHYIVGLNGEILRCIPENERAQHAGKSYAPQYEAMAKTNNSRYIGIEVCHPDANGKFSNKTYAALVELVADICCRHGFDPQKDVVRHYDITGKDCPLYYVRNPMAWALLLKDIGGFEMVDTTKVLFNEKEVEVERILKNDTNYMKMRDLEKFGLKVAWDEVRKIPVITK